MGITRQVFILSLLIIGFLPFSGFSQVNPENAIIHKLDGKKYYLHTVKKGNTLYSISKVYAIEIEEIVAENPGIEKGLTINQIIKIPAKKVDKKEFESNQLEMDGEFLVHQVKPKETLFLLGKTYNVKVDDILKANPELVGGLKIGTNVKIPVVKTDEKAPIERQAAVPDSLISHEVQPKETLYSLSKNYEVDLDSLLKINMGLPNGLVVGQIIRIPKFSEDYLKQKAEKRIAKKLELFKEVKGDTSIFKDTFKIICMLPFYLDLNDSLQAKQKEFEESKIYPKSSVALDFYKGILFALDSISGLKYKYSIEFFDTQNDLNIVKQRVADSSFLKFDLVIGPLYKSNFEIVSKICSKQNMHQVSPVPLSNKILLGNKNVSKIVPSLPSHIKAVTDFVLDTSDTSKVYLISSQKLKDYDLFTYCKRQIRDFEVLKFDSVKYDTIQTLSMTFVDTNIIKNTFKDSGSYKLIIPSTDQVFVTELLTKLFEASDRCKFEVYGLEPWNGYDNIDFEYFEALSVHLSYFQYLDLNNEANITFYKGFRNKFFTDPNTYSTIGFNATYFYLKGLDMYGKRFPNNYKALSEIYPNLGLDFYQTGLESGYENGKLSIIKYQNYQLVKVEK